MRSSVDWVWLKAMTLSIWPCSTLLMRESTASAAPCQAVALTGTVPVPWTGVLMMFSWSRWMCCRAE